MGESQNNLVDSAIHPDMTVLEIVERWPAARAVFQRYGIPTGTDPCPYWETIEQAAAVRGHWASDQLLGELNQAAGGEAGLRPDTSLVDVAATYPAARAILERYGIPCQADRVAPWESVEQAAAARGHWAADTLLEELKAICS